jgi:hypothetical protein
MTTQHSLPEVPDAAVEAVLKRREVAPRHRGFASRAINADLRDALPSLHAAWEKEREAKLRKAAEDVLEFEAQIERRGDASAMEDYEGAINDLRAALEIR